MSTEGIKKVKISVNDLSLDMFVSGLDRPWNQTPFPLQGFYIRSAEDIVLLRTYCNHVYIDVAKGPGPASIRLQLQPKAPTGTKASRTAKPTVADFAPVEMPPLKVVPNRYPVEQALKKEVNKAKQLHDKVHKALNQVMVQLEQGTPLQYQQTKQVCQQMIDSVLRNPDAFTWLTRVREKDEHTYSHSVRSAVWAILLGRHIGMERRQLEILALGVLLKDVGKLRLSTDLITNPRRTDVEEADYREFVNYGVEILRQTPDIDPPVISVVKHHMERIDGSGYPRGLRGDKIPLLGRIAGVVTTYDDITNPRTVSQPVAPSRAIAKLYAMRGRQFQEDLVVEFIRAVGLYPTGTLVELNTGEVAVVVEQNFARRLKPRVMVVLDEHKRPLAEPVFFDLLEDERKKRAQLEAGKIRKDQLQLVEISKDLEPESFDVDITAVRDSHLDLNKRTLLGLFG